MNDVIRVPDDASHQSAVNGGMNIRPVLLEQSSVSPEQLMLCDEAAQAKFIRASGVTTCNREIRFVRRAD
jgi:hypothetical protein